MSFSEQDKIKILKLKSGIASYYNLTMKKIGDRTLESLFYSNCVISGGMISSIFHDEPVNDIDLYATSVKGMTTIKDHIIGSGKNIKKIEKRWVGTYGAGGVSGHPASRNPWSNIWAAMASRLALRF